MSDYITKEGDALDLICLRHYGQRVGMVERVLEANPHLRAVAHRLPARVKITLPVAAHVDAPRRRPALWG